MPLGRDLSVFYGFQQRTAFFLGVCAFCVAAFADIWLEFAENVWQVILGIEIKLHKVEHAEARRIGKITAHLAAELPVQRIQLNVPGRVTPACGFFADFVA